MLRQRWRKIKEDHDFANGGWMLYSTDATRRHEGSAGGVVTELTRYLLEKNIVRTALGFEYQGATKSFNPKWVYLPQDVITSGSIYHEIPLIRFLRRNLNEVHPPLLVIALPCQVRAVRAVCDRASIAVYIISLVCSGQLTLEATRELFSRVTEGRDVIKYRYRGGGWPSGVRITCKDGEEIFVDNNNSIWMDIFHAAVFNLPRCFRCRDTFGVGADMTVGDPWLPRYVQNETEGVSMCVPHSRWAISVLNKMIKSECISMREIVSSQEVLTSQLWTLEKKAIYRAHPRWISTLRILYRQPWYMKLVFSRNIRGHLRFHRKCMNILRRL